MSTICSFSVTAKVCRPISLVTIVIRVPTFTLVGVLATAVAVARGSDNNRICSSFVRVVPQNEESSMSHSNDPCSDGGGCLPYLELTTEPSEHDYVGDVGAILISTSPSVCVSGAGKSEQSIAPLSTLNEAVPLMQCRAADGSLKSDGSAVPAVPPVQDLSHLYWSEFL